MTGKRVLKRFFHLHHRRRLSADHWQAYTGAGLLRGVFLLISGGVLLRGLARAGVGQRGRLRLLRHRRRRQHPLLPLHDLQRPRRRNGCWQRTHPASASHKWKINSNANSVTSLSLS